MIIIPERKICDCGKPVLNHHWLCDKCYSKKAEKENRKKQQILLYEQRNNKVATKPWKKKRKNIK